MNLTIGDRIFDKLLKEGASSPRLRANLDLRNTPSDTSQRMLNALQPGTVVPIHRHRRTSETVVVLKGSLAEVYYDDNGKETERIELAATGADRGVQIPADRWHTIEVHEPSVIIEIKDGAYAPLADDEIL